MKPIFFTVLFIITSSFCFAQEEYQNYFQGFQNEVSGKRFAYHSPFPNVKNSLLLRGQEDYLPIVWNTEIVPENYPNDYVTFVWVFGMDVNSDQVGFDLFVNEMNIVSFSSSKTSELGLSTIKGNHGSTLTFNVTLLDKYEDQMGFAILKLPVSAINLGEQNTLKLQTDTKDNNAWFMTFKTEIEEKISIYQNKVVVKKNNSLFHSISVDFIHLGENAEAVIEINGGIAKTKLKTGFNKLEIYLPKAENLTNHTALIKIGNKKSKKIDFSLELVKEWEILFVQHTHSDIGYTRSQTEILPEHLRYIDNALDFCDQTDNYPDASKFRWTCETSWSVREYFKSRPQGQIDRLLKRIKEGRIEVTGMFLNFSDIIDESGLSAQTKTLKMFKDKGVKVTTAMQNDVNGIGWSIIDNFHNTDVKYLTMGLHAHRARRPFGMPTAFWWQSPAGNRLLAYRSEHYQHGNSLSLTTGQQDVLLTNLSNYLTELEEKGYPYDKISLQFSGYVTDNSPPSIKVCDIINAWNEKYKWPKLKNSLANEFMIFLEKEHENSIVEKKVAWPDWWTDGVGSAANETKVARNTQVELIANTGILTMAKTLGVDLPKDIQQEIGNVYDNLLFYYEHTHGAAESVSDPLAQNTVNQWAMKSSYVWEAAKRSSALQEKALAFIETVLDKSSLPTITVFNTLNWERSGMVNLFIQFEVIPDGFDYTIVDGNGDLIPSQIIEKREEGAYYNLWVEDIPSFGYKTLQVNVGDKSQTVNNDTSFKMENDFYSITLSKENGIINQIFDKKLKKNLVKTIDSISFGQMIYERLKNRHDMERLTQTNRDTLYKPLALTRKTLQNVKIIKTVSGSIYKSIFLNGMMPVCADERGVTIEIRLYHHVKKIELHYQMFKLPIYEPEGVYISFPFELDNGHLAFEAQGGVVYPGINQLEGSSSDWNGIQNFASVRNNDSQIVFTSGDIPLVQFGDINTGRYYYRLAPKTNHIYSWVMNNYWVTNFKASQQGELRWSYSFTSSDKKTDIFATKFGWGERVPILSRIVLPKKGEKQSKLLSKSVINLAVPNLLLVNSTLSLDGKGIVLHVREIEGDHAIIDINRMIKETNASSIYEVNVLEENLQKLDSPLLIEHFETKFIKINFKTN